MTKRSPKLHACVTKIFDKNVSLIQNRNTSHSSHFTLNKWIYSQACEKHTKNENVLNLCVEGMKTNVSIGDNNALYQK